MLILQFDGQFLQQGGTAPEMAHAGLMGYGWLIFEDDRQIAHGWGAFAQGKTAASNIAEYLALIEGLDALIDMGGEKQIVEVRGDARCVIDQMAGLASVNSPATREIYHRARHLSRNFARIDWVWIPRCSNKKADWLSRHAIRQTHYIPGAFNKALGMIEPSNSRYKPVCDLRVYTALHARV